MLLRRLSTWAPFPGYSLKCGLEIHTQLKTNHKLFSLSKNSPDSAPNANTSYFDYGLPGTFPKLNPEALLLALKAAAALNSDISELSHFDRKHYFYLDQPLGYQLTQHHRPLAKNGSLTLTKKYDNVEKDHEIRIEQIQLEQDTGKLNYNEYDGTITIDLNRANVPLIELVTKPDFTHIDQVKAFVRKYLTLMSHLGVCSGDMEKGAMRCDVNISVNDGKRVEVKNLGSTSEIVAAATYEYYRQVDQLKTSNEEIMQETRAWDGKATIRRRDKEDANDYRYLPDTEIPCVYLDAKIGDEIRAILPELPDQILDKLTQEPYGLEVKHARFLVDNVDIIGYYYDLYEYGCIGAMLPVRTVNNWLLHELIGAFKKLELPFDRTMISPRNLTVLMVMVNKKKITFSSAKLLLVQLLSGPAEDRSLSMHELVEKYDLGSANAVPTEDLDQAVSEICQEIIDANSDVVARIRGGKRKSLNHLIGLAMRQTSGKVDSKEFEKAFIKLIG
ncbi:aspartyl/glutamyl-tRNA(Asn/Gln)_amidotransferase,_B_subunit [Candidozyma auris]|uniref:glutamyl-tRNA(Gln) amidotransferase subunit PET112 n=1 Tax=Candidozyma auris TaxID=498019 RepID=UPI000D2AB2EE|nr:aspartyl/glutamyl-tRNA(Asn/Gln)_amidotransferase,_B_subunit [[Candida] auris]QEO22985.1 aspartyl/glutamyl-tRNA(Asn/Gln)_amidotransferase,_B_subunit [[Candida] auris]GBL49032.1 aspartyl/glutamyl-tRNA amidotransferase, B subunit [[Candida] auris]